MGDFPFNDPDEVRYDGQTLIVRGIKSHYVADDVLPLIGRFFPMFKLISVDSGHWVISEKPEAFRQGTFWRLPGRPQCWSASRGGLLTGGRETKYVMRLSRLWTIFAPTIHCNFSTTEVVDPSDRLASSRAALINLYALHVRMIRDGRGSLTRLRLQMLASNRDQIRVMTINMQPVVSQHRPNGSVSSWRPSQNEASPYTVLR